MTTPDRFVLWTRSTCAWVPVFVSRDGVALLCDAEACEKDGLRVIVLPEGKVPCDA